MDIFERKIEITDPAAIKRFAEIMAEDPPEKLLSNHPYTDVERERSEKLLKRCLSLSRS